MDAIKELKDNVKIVDYVLGHYKDRLQGINRSDDGFVCRCVFHDDNNPSMSFSEKRNRFHCFACEADGDVIDFVMKMDGLPFKDACMKIGMEIGHPIRFEPPNPLYEQHKKAMEAHKYRYCVNLARNRRAAEYLMQERGLSINTIAEFGLGITDQAEYKYRSDTGNISGKISIPITECRSYNPATVGFAYRDIDGNGPKYVNDKTQEGLFVKGNVVFNYARAYHEVKKNGYVIVVEGYMDAISLWQAEIRNVVALMGTSMTERQAEIITGMTSNVMLLLDGDKAGTKAMGKILSMLLPLRANVSVAKLPGGMDPADLCLDNKFDQRKVAIKIRKRERYAGIFVIEDRLGNFDQKLFALRLEAIQQVMPIIEQIPDKSLRDLYRKTLYQKLSL